MDEDKLTSYPKTSVKTIPPTIAVFFMLPSLTASYARIKSYHPKTSVKTIPPTIAVFMLLLPNISVFFPDKTSLSYLVQFKLPRLTIFTGKLSLPTRPYSLILGYRTKTLTSFFEAQARFRAVY
jgi:hypothetical protein